MTIQVDMFEVQLGAAILLQFKVGEEWIRVLADAGVKAGGYPASHVLEKLSPILGDRPRIDLIIGTHYDEDHLNGLVPIIEDLSIEIGEAWMPPVANDTRAVAVDQPLADSDLLAHQLAGEDGGQVLSAYLAAKREDIQAVSEIESVVDPENAAGDHARFMHTKSFAETDRQSLNFFRAQLRQDEGDDMIDHGSEQEVEPHPLVASMADQLTRGADPWWHYPPATPLERLKAYAVDRRDVVAQYGVAQARSLMQLRRSAAKDAINANALHDVVQALSARRVPIRSEVIDDGVPRHYLWNAASKRFVLARRGGDGVRLVLLGPSKSLVKKHRDKLPVMDASKIALAFRGEIRSITPSNQLSYIGCFKANGQTILISGDAGCVDFKLGRSTYYPQLLAEMQPLHVVQVAHHGGNNAHFYRVLAEAGYPEQGEPSFLLLSHGTHDRTRPSPVFHDFLMTTLRDGDDVRLLFTSEPTRDKVEDYLSAIHPRVGASGTVGDIRLSYDHGAWTVDSHAIQVP